MKSNEKRAIFDALRKSLIDAGITTTAEDSLICPLCWQETPYEQLSIEHIIPGSVGGRRTTLTCRACNNDHGSEFDAHLARYQQLKDAFQGHGTLRTKLNVAGHEMIANLRWGNEHKHFDIVGKATNPAAIEASQKTLAKEPPGEMKFTLYYNYNQNKFRIAVLRAAYLVLFNSLGYHYIHDPIIQRIRQLIANPSPQLINLASLIIEAKNFIPPCNSQHYFVPGHVNGVGLWLVLLRVRRETTTYLGAYLPMPDPRSGEFFELMEIAAKEHNGTTFPIPRSAIFT